MYSNKQLQLSKDERYEFIKNITLTGIFEDPIEANAFCGEDKVAICNPMETSFHTSPFIMDTVSKTAWDLMTKARAAAKTKFLNNDTPVDATTQTPQRPQQQQVIITINYAGGTREARREEYLVGS